MIIEWMPCWDNRPAIWTQPEKDKIVVIWRGETVAVDLSDEDIVEYILEPSVNSYIHAAWREDGTLHLRVPSLGNLSRETVIDHGENKELTWSGSSQPAEREVK